MKLFGKHKSEAPAPVPYDREKLKPVLRCSICTGEQVAGFKDLQTGRFIGETLVTQPKDLEGFLKKYGLESIDKEY